MPKLKNINFSTLLFGAALLATSATHCFNPSKIEAASSSAFERSRSPVEIAKGDSNQDLAQNKPLPLTGWRSATQSKTILLAQDTDSTIEEGDNRQSRNSSIRLAAFTFFLLFFVPLGIFYPLFLFYKMLLIKPEQSGLSLTASPKPVVAESTNVISPDSQTRQGITKATVSKLQIALSPPARELRKELSRVSLLADINPDDDLIERIRQTVIVLVEQGHWTHVSHSSITLPLKKVKFEFDSLCDRERHKFANEHPALINYNRNVSSSEGYERNYSYVVVTLVFCTSHATPLFQTISTKERLVEELVKLGEMESDSAIKFELIWNPQHEDIYISNEQLLIEYEDLTRLL